MVPIVTRSLYALMFVVAMAAAAYLAREGQPVAALAVVITAVGGLAAAYLYVASRRAAGHPAQGDQPEGNRELEAGRE